MKNFMDLYNSIDLKILENEDIDNKYQASDFEESENIESEIITKQDLLELINELDDDEIVFLSDYINMGLRDLESIYSGEFDPFIDNYTEESDFFDLDESEILENLEFSKNLDESEITEDLKSRISSLQKKRRQYSHNNIADKQFHINHKREMRTATYKLIKKLRNKERNYTAKGRLDKRVRKRKGKIYRKSHIAYYRRLRRLRKAKNIK